MAIRVDSASFSGTGICVGGTGLGLKGSVIRATTATGTHGPGLLYDDWDSAADDNKEFRAFITSWPAGATLFVHEDGSFSLTGADGSYTIGYRLDIDGASQGTTSETVNVGVLTVQADFTAARPILAAVQQDFAGARTLLAAVQADLTAARVVLAAVQQDFSGARDLLDGVVVDLAAARSILAAVQQDFAGTREIEASGQVSADFAATRTLLLAVHADFSATRSVLGATDNCPTAAEIAAAVRAELATELGLLMDLARIHGLQPGTPLVVTPTSRQAGVVEQTVTKVGETVTVERV